MNLKKERKRCNLERVAGIEPASSAWKAEVLPLNYTRTNKLYLCRSFYTSNKEYKRSQQSPSIKNQFFDLLNTRKRNLVVGAGFEPAKLSRQIYSLIPLATREPHQMLRYFIQEVFFVNPTFLSSATLFIGHLRLSSWLTVSLSSEAYTRETLGPLQSFTSLFSAHHSSCRPFLRFSIQETGQ